MEANQIIAALAALAHESRLAVFRALVQAGPEGMSAGQIATLLDVPPSSLSFHLKELAYAQLVTSRQEGRFVFYCGNFATMNGLLAYLTENCCGGNPCSPVPACPTPDRCQS
ncbi:ArsR family transcriptional regulator [Burkholderia sp. MSMB1459WGS]|uniref:ArsR/SmtB family transcription factor n=1 Tax=unclassified Burkholderia TaxID=2613784 RepID=UPI00075C45BF|nr:MULTISPECIES: metalloregulator ArsR/SmtB family transcription factor [unclassified Burkholderia]KVD35991.1 ArsR family transcriptional regulator [Burkholderia sp. ABCPW 11]KWO47289.1 ArsR family transcriptional regulator [Burkholderia sp. MSMB1459WGS]